MVHSKDPRRLSGSPRTWVLFFFSLAVNALLAWGPWTDPQRLWLFPLGLALQVTLGLRLASLVPGKKDPLSRMDPPLAPTPSWWAALALAGLFLRFFGLESLSVWPSWDDSYNAYFAIRSAEHFQGGLFYGSQQSLPLSNWLQGSFFKIVTPSPFSMWFYCAFFSACAVPLGYLAARQYFSRSFSFLLTMLLATGFWPVFWGKFNTNFSCVNLAWELLLLFALGRLLKPLKKGEAPRPAFLLGLGAGLGLYLSFYFLILSFLCLCVVSWTCWREPRRLKTLLFFSVPLAVLALFLAPGLFENFTKGHLHTYITHPSQEVDGAAQLISSFSYLSSFFWGSLDRSYHTFAAPWGGFLNPLLTTLFFIGLGGSFRSSGTRFFIGFFFPILLLLLPGLASNSIECMRVFPVLPFFLVLIALGFSLLLSLVPSGKRSPLLVVFFFLTLSLDGYHLLGPYPQWAGSVRPGNTFKSYERLHAFPFLKEASDREGPGWVLCDFVSDVYDQSLFLATYRFNAARNPRLDPSQAKWVAVMAELHYQEPLMRRFPRAQCRVLSDQASADRPGSQVLLLAVIPVTTDEERRVFLRWMEVHRRVQDLYGLMPYHVENPDFSPVIRSLLALTPRTEGDPLLKGWILERSLDLLMASRDLTDALWFLEKPLEATRSYPFFDWKFAQMYHRLGLGLVKGGRKKEAAECFRRVARLDPKYDLASSLALCR